MVEDKAEPREVNWRHLLPWIDLFQGFRVAMDLNKLLLAAAGILVMAFGWWLLASLFHTQKPDWDAKDYAHSPDEETAKWAQFKLDRGRWNLLHETAGAEDDIQVVEPGDVAENANEYKALKSKYEELSDQWKERHFRGPPSEIIVIDRAVNEGKITREEAKLRKLGLRRPAGRLRTWPWLEDRGPNPYLMATGAVPVPWETGHFWDWLLTKEIPVLIEPLVKLLLPVRYFFSADAGPYNKFYFLLVTIWTLVTWSFFGGAITRIAAVQVTRQEKIGLMEAVRFTGKRFLSYITAPLFPMAFIFLLVVVMVIYGVIHMIPGLGDLVDILLWWLMVVFGLIMAVLLVGMVTWPLMSAAVSTEGTDSWEAVSRSYSYLIQAPWHFIWYCLVALVYGAVLIFFVGFMGSMMVYLGKWGVSQTPFIESADRDPSYLFVYAPTSFGWRELLLQGARTADGALLVDHGQINQQAYNDYFAGWHWWNYAAASVVSVVWIGLIFLLVIGFGYSYFWCASTIIYLLMRRKVDDAEMDEIYLEEDDQDMSYTPPPSAATTPPGPSLTMVEPPSMRPSPMPEPPEQPAPAGVSSTAPPAPPRTEPPSSPGVSGNGGSAPGTAG